MLYSYDSNAQIIRRSTTIRSESFLKTDSVLREDSLNEQLIKAPSFTNFPLEPEAPSIFSDKFTMWPVQFKILVFSSAIVFFVFLTWSFANFFPANLAAVSTCTVAHVLFPDVLEYASIGAYAGMTRFSEAIPVLFLSVFTCISAHLGGKFLPGRGGRLGTLSFIGSICAISVASATNLASWSMIYDPAIGYRNIDLWLVLVFMCGNWAGTISTAVLRKFRPLLSPIAAGNASSLFLIIIVESYLTAIPSALRTELSGCILQGAFVGASSELILPSFPSFMSASTLSGLMTLSLYPVCSGGVGGKRGVMALLGVLLFEFTSGKFDRTNANQTHPSTTEISVVKSHQTPD
jgi:hypothetical protein